MNDKQRIMHLEIKVAELIVVVGAMIDAASYARDYPNINYNCSQCGSDPRITTTCLNPDYMNGLHEDQS